MGLEDVPVFGEYVTDGGVLVVVGCREGGSPGVGLGLVHEEGLSVDITSSVLLGGGVLCWITTLAEFGFDFVHGAFCILVGRADLFASEELAVWDFRDLLWWMI